MNSDIFKVIGVSPNLIQIEILDIEEFKKSHDKKLSLGSYIKITDDKGMSVIAIVLSYKVRDIGLHKTSF